MELTKCDNAEELVRTGFTRTFAERIVRLKESALFYPEELIATVADGGVGLKLKHVKALMQSEIVMKLYGTVINWEQLLRELQYRKLSVKERKKLEEKELNDAMHAYWVKAVKHIQDGGSPHPGLLIHQSFVHKRIAKYHEVRRLLSRASSVC